MLSWFTRKEPANPVINGGFSLALSRVLEHEGGYVNHPSDPGGETNKGITRNTARAHGYNGSMRDIPDSVVADIYRKGYWDAAKCGDMPFMVGFQLFDACVNHGVSNGSRMLQQALGVTADGIVGNETLKAVRSRKPYDLVMSFWAARVRFYTRLGTFNTFGKGWMNRMADNYDYGAIDAD